MRRPQLTILGALGALLGDVLAVGASPGTATAADQRAGVVTAPAATTKASQERIADYWTPTRMRNAKVADAPDSLRIDIPKDDVTPNNRRVEGVDYTTVFRSEWTDMKPVYAVVNEALAEAEKKKSGK